MSFQSSFVEIILIYLHFPNRLAFTKMIVTGSCVWKIRSFLSVKAGKMEKKALVTPHFPLVG
jgi:hypothetical protein